MIRCPECKRSSSLREVFEAEVTAEVEGTRPLDSNGEPRHKAVDYDLDYLDLQPSFGQPVGIECTECEWEGPREELELVGWDGEPLPELNPDQLAFVG